jgi:hypothetical protein
MDKKRNNEPFLGTTGVNKVIDKPESVVDVSAIIGDHPILLLTEQSNLTTVKMPKN